MQHIDHYRNLESAGSSSSLVVAWKKIVRIIPHREPGDIEVACHMASDRDTSVTVFECPSWVRCHWACGHNSLSLQIEWVLKIHTGPFCDFWTSRYYYWAFSMTEIQVLWLVVYCHTPYHMPVLHHSGYYTNKKSRMHTPIAWHGSNNSIISPECIHQ